MTTSVLSVPPVQIRPMTELDIPQLAAVHLAAFQGFPNADLGLGYARAMLRWFLRSPHGISIIAERDQVPCGYVVGALLGYQRSFTRDLFWPAAIGFLIHPRSWFSRRLWRAGIARLKAVIRSAPETAKPTLPEPTYSFVSLAVAPAFRRERIGYVLMNACEDEARRRGAAALRCSTNYHNKAAISLLYQLGYREFDANGFLYFYKILS